MLNIKTPDIDLSFNIIVTIHPKAFWTSESNNKSTHTELKRLYLEYNNIKYIKSGTFDPLINLEKLYLYRNQFSNIDNALILNLNKLIHFDISYNKLTKLPIKWLPNSLQRLFIEGNAIEYMSIDTFEGAFNLIYIAFSTNNIIIEYNTFSNHTKLNDIRVHPLIFEMCTCKYIWYLNTISDSAVCDNNNNKHGIIRDYLKEECKAQLTG